MASAEQEPRTIVRQFIEEAWNEKDLELVDELVSPDGVLHDPTLPDVTEGTEAAKRAIQLYHAAYPDAHIEIEDQIAEGDTVATRWTGTGTHEGELMGIEPTGEEVDVSGIQFDRVEDGKIVETWTVYDTLGMLQQLGAVPDLAAE